MSRSFTPEQLLAKLRENCDIENDQHVTDTELYKVLTGAVADTWDKVISAGLAEKYVKTATFNAVAGTIEYAIGSGLAVNIADFYKVSQLYVNEGDGRLRPIPRLNPAEQYAFKAPQSTVAMKLYYIPCAPTIEDGGSSFDGINGFEEHTLAVAEIAVRKKRDESTSEAWRVKQAVEERIARSNTDHGEPTRVVRRRYRANDPFWVYNNNVNAWNVRGDKIELYYYYGYMP